MYLHLEDSNIEVLVSYTNICCRDDMVNDGVKRLKINGDSSIGLPEIDHVIESRFLIGNKPFRLREYSFDDQC
jgi:hypothetical protein